MNLSDLRKITYIASKDLGWDTGRGTAAFNNNGSLSLPSAGIYLFVTETWTKSDFNTRTWAAMDNTVANIGMTTKSPPKIVGEGYLQIIQLCVASAAMTVNCQYWDAAGTGAAHRWTAYKLFA